MKREPTVLLSLVIFAIAWILALVLKTPHTITPDDPARFHIIFWVMFACAIRASILWLQTLVHAVKTRPTDSRVGWVLGHVFLGPITSYFYYFTVKTEKQKTTQQIGAR